MKDNNYKFGRESRLISSRISMNCDIDNIAFYNEFYAYRLSKNNYELSNFSSDIGVSDQIFSISIRDYIEELSRIENARIAICEKGKLYFGLPALDGMSELPPECHFYYRYDSLDRLNIKEEGVLYFKSKRYISQEKFDEIMIPE